MKRRVLNGTFFARSPLVAARELLGKYLVRRLNGKEIARMITETEAYWGRGDMSSHAAMGPTKRNKVMFGPAGCWYVYFIYGMYHCLNIVTGREGEASAVLLRGVEGVSGPGKLCREFRIDLTHYGRLAARRHGLWIEDRGFRIKDSGYRVRRTPRVNIGGDLLAKERLWRFLLVKDNSK